MADILKFIEFNQYNFPFLLQILAIYLGIVWLAVVVWVLRDITTRSHNLLLIVAATFFVLLGNLPALILYLLIRPEKTLEEGKSKDLFYASVLDKDVTSCRNCGTLARSDYKFCANCSYPLQERCPHCGITVNPTWRFCANCQLYLLPLPWYKKMLQQLPEAPRLSAPKFDLQLPKLNFKRIDVNLNQVKQFLNEKRPAIKAAASKSKAKVRSRVELPALEVASLAVTNQHAATRIMTASKTAAVQASALQAVAISKVDQAGRASAIDQLAQKRRGRPKGKPDSKPRAKRADAGKKRGSYKRAS